MAYLRYRCSSYESPLHFEHIFTVTAFDRSHLIADRAEVPSTISLMTSFAAAIQLPGVGNFEVVERAFAADALGDSLLPRMASTTLRHHVHSAGCHHDPSLSYVQSKRKLKMLEV